MIHEVSRNNTRTYHVEDTWYVDVEYVDDTYYLWLNDTRINRKALIAFVDGHQEGRTIHFEDLIGDIEALFNSDEFDPRPDYIDVFEEEYENEFCDGDCANCPYEDEDDDECDDDDYNADFSIYGDGNRIKNINTHLLYDESGRPKILF